MSALIEGDDVGEAEFEASSSGPSESSRPRIVAAHKWIERQYMRPLTVNRIARHVGLTAIRLEREFTEIYGESPRALLMRCRMIEAQRLMETGHDSSAVAVLVGYAAEHAFLNDYRRWRLRKA